MLIVVALVGCEWLETDPLDVPYEEPRSTVVEGTAKSRDGIALPTDRGKLTKDPTELQPTKAGEKAEEGRRWHPVRVPKSGEVENREDLTKIRTNLTRADGTPIIIRGTYNDAKETDLDKQLRGATNRDQAAEIQIEIDTANGKFPHGN